MGASKEVEIKFRVSDIPSLNRRLRSAKFRLITPRTHELNVLYDWPGQTLRKQGELLRLRKYGDRWIFTHKSKSVLGKHKSRIETETRVVDGPRMDMILRAMGLKPTFRYEKFRAEWSDGKGHVVVDETPIGNFGEIEGPPRWIDTTASHLGVSRADYVTLSYAPLFLAWKKQTGISAREMTFSETKKRKRSSN
jgi:adenylate cyclase, class 2